MGVCADVAVVRLGPAPLVLLSPHPDTLTANASAMAVTNTAPPPQVLAFDRT